MDLEIEPSSERLKEAVRQLKEWMVKEPHLPNIDDEEWLLTFFYNNKFSLEKTKSKLDGYYSLKNKYPHILKNRDPLAPEMLLSRNAVTLCISDKLTKDGCRMLFCKMSSDSSIFHAGDFFKRIFMGLDMLLLEKDRLVNYIFISDFKDHRYQHFLKLLTEIKSGSEIFIKAYTERLKSIHLINVPPYVDKMVEVITAHFPKKYADRIFIHTTSKNMVTEMVDVDVLSSDAGGKGPSLKYYSEYTQGKFDNYRSWFAEQDNVCSNDQLRRGRDNQQEELKGSFRKLDID